jgi:(S)-2-hydroxyglutarate dehydrogenase
MAEAADVLIVGGGVVGLTLARELLARGRENVVVLEKEPALGRHASGRNSGVLHAGIYYAPDSLKARSCLRGNLLLRAYCQAHGLPLVETGKVIVARDASELANGAEVDLLDDHQLAQVEPAARSAGLALYSRLTAVFDPLAVLERLRADLTASGRVRVLTGRAFLGLAGPHTAATSGGPLSFRRLVNAAGAHCDRVARAFGLGREYRLVPFKGIYRKLRSGASFPVRGNVYPVPDVRNPFLGVHFTRSARGELYVGPTAIPALGRENYGLVRGIDREAPALLLRDAALFVTNQRFRSVALTEPRKYMPCFFHGDAARLVRGYDPRLFERATKVGIRPQLVDWRTKELVMDFLVVAKDETVHVLNPVSPAFTSSMDLARSIADAHFPG